MLPNSYQSAERLVARPLERCRHPSATILVDIANLAADGSRVEKPEPRLPRIRDTTENAAIPNYSRLPRHDPRLPDRYRLTCLPSYPLVQPGAALPAKKLKRSSAVCISGQDRAGGATASTGNYGLSSEYSLNLTAAKRDVKQTVTRNGKFLTEFRDTPERHAKSSKSSKNPWLLAGHHEHRKWIAKHRTIGS
jgi:hypothetical protein